MFNADPSIMDLYPEKKFYLLNNKLTGEEFYIEESHFNTLFETEARRLAIKTGRDTQFSALLL